MDIKEIIAQTKDLLLLKNIIFKAIALSFIFLCFGYLTDEILGYSYFSINDKRITQIERIEKLKTTYSKDTILVLQLNKLKNDIIDYQAKKPKLWNYLPDSLSLSSRSTLDNSKSVRKSNTTIPQKKASNVSIFYQILSSSFFFMGVVPV